MEAKSGGGKTKKGWIYFVVLLSIVGGAFLGLSLLSGYRRRKRAENQKSAIFSCLQKFDVEDVDLRRSPPGGWHGTYMNKLAYGFNESQNSMGNDGIMVSETE